VTRWKLPGLWFVYTIRRREVTRMNSFEIIMVILGVFGLPITTGMLIIALLTYLDNRYNKRK